VWFNRGKPRPTIKEVLFLDIAGIGIPFFDQIVSIKTLPTTDTHPQTLDASWQYGGKVPTALVAAARLGFLASIHANVGGSFGQCIRRDFIRHGIDCTFLYDIPGKQSPVTICLAVKSTGGRSFVGLPNPIAVPDISASQLNKGELLKAKWLLISDFGEAAKQAAKWFKEAGKPVVMDADYVQLHEKDFLPLVDHFIASEYTFKNFSDGAPNEEALRKIRSWQNNPHAVTVVTLGANGLAGINNNGDYFHMEAYKVDVADTTGAGDVFHGAYIAALLKGYDVISSCNFAQATAAIKCTKLGGRAGIPTWAQVEEFLQTGLCDFVELEERAEYYRKAPF